MDDSIPATAKPLSADQLRSFVRRHADFLAILYDCTPYAYGQTYDDAVNAAARSLVDYAVPFCDLVCVGTGLTDAEVQATPWPRVVKLGCEVIDLTREAWRLAAPFLLTVLRSEIEPFSTELQRQEAAR